MFRLHTYTTFSYTRVVGDFLNVEKVKNLRLTIFFFTLMSFLTCLNNRDLVPFNKNLDITQIGFTKRIALCLFTLALGYIANSLFSHVVFISVNPG